METPRSNKYRYLHDIDREWTERPVNRETGGQPPNGAAHAESQAEPVTGGQTKRILGIPDKPSFFVSPTPPLSQPPRRTLSTSLLPSLCAPLYCTTGPAGLLCTRSCLSRGHHWWPGPPIRIRPKINPQLSGPFSYPSVAPPIASARNYIPRNFLHCVGYISTICNRSM